MACLGLLSLKTWAFHDVLVPRNRMVLDGTKAVATGIVQNCGLRPAAVQEQLLRSRDDSMTNNIGLRMNLCALLLV